MRSMELTGPTRTAPRWAGDFRGPESLVPGGAKVDAAQFNAANAVPVTVTTAGNIADETMDVAALAGPIPSGTLLAFDDGSYARTTADAAAGAVALDIEPLITAVADDSTALYAGSGAKVIPSGTAIGRTFAERADATPFGPADAGDDEVFLTAFDTDDITRVNDVELYRHGRIVKENFLPVVPADMDADVLARIRELYVTTIGQE